jgi:hypothetical protein
MEESYSDWEPLLLNAGYEYAYFDGLNRYYVAGEHEILKSAFEAPSNVFDEFIRCQQLESELWAREAEAKVNEVEQRASEAEARAHEAETLARQAETLARQAEDRAAQAEAKAKQAQRRAAQVEARAHEAETKALQAEERAAQAEATLQAVYSGHSWRVTKPLRWLASTLRLLREKAIGTSFNKTSNWLAHTPSMTAAPELMELSPRAREIYFQLKAAVEKNQENR